MVDEMEKLDLPEQEVEIARTLTPAKVVRQDFSCALKLSFGAYIVILSVLSADEF